MLGVLSQEDSALLAVLITAVVAPLGLMIGNRLIPARDRTTSETVHKNQLSNDAEHQECKRRVAVLEWRMSYLMKAIVEADTLIHIPPEAYLEPVFDEATGTFRVRREYD